VTIHETGPGNADAEKRFCFNAGLSHGFVRARQKLMRQPVRTSFQSRSLPHHRADSRTKIHDRCEHRFIVKPNSQEEAMLLVETKQNPFYGEVEALRKVYWVKPELVAEIEYAEWTEGASHGSGPKLRAPVFLGLRDDKDPKDCLLEERPRTEH